jgi:hypothetical protein
MLSKNFAVTACPPFAVNRNDFTSKKNKTVITILKSKVDICICGRRSFMADAI